MQLRTLATRVAIAALATCVTACAGNPSSSGSNGPSSGRAGAEPPSTNGSGASAGPSGSPEPSSDAGASGDDSGSPSGSGGSGAHDASAGPTGAGDAAPGDLAAARALCVQTINDYRATLGLAPYAPWDEIDACVDGEARSDSISGTPHSAFGTCAEHAQNECPDWPMAPGTMITRCLKDMWAEGPGDDFEKHGHYINMSSTKYTKVSCGYFQTPDGHWWATQDFR
jgi:hypothetical protein